MRQMMHPFKALGIAVAIMVVLITLLGITVSHQIDKNGGVKQILIDVGKDAKDIVKEVEEH
jgi:hypothetical protein